MSALNLEIISAKGILFKGQCYMAVVPSIEGDIGIMQGHESIISKLREGVIDIYSDLQTVLKKFDVVGGYAEISDANKLIILLD